MQKIIGNPFYLIGLKSKIMLNQKQNLTRTILVTLLLAGVSAGHPVAAPIFTPDTTKIFYTERVTSPGITIDGKLNDPAWQSAHFQSDMTQRQPLDGVPVSQRTAFSILYDNHNLYVGIYAYDSLVNAIKGILSRRDENSPSDWLYVGIDSYNDKRTAFGFGVNPAGVKADMRWYNDENQDQNWDGIWEGKASINNDGWSAEFKIPFRELRFSGSRALTFGLQIYRRINRLNEEDWWANWPQNESGFVRHFGELRGLDDIPRQDRLSLAPYLNHSVTHSRDLINSTHPQAYDFGKNIGADIKYGVTNDLTLDATLNPDFGQVEADPAELNLSAFESYFPEKRPFFVEGSNIFNYSLGFGDGDLQNLSLFYSRRIGRQPQYYPDFDSDSGYNVDLPRRTNILAAAKLSGKTRNGWSIGVLDAVTARETALLRSDIAYNYSVAVEPRTNYFVGRLQRDLNAGGTTVGGIITAANRDLNNLPQLNWLRRDAYAGGLDVSHRFWNNRYALDFALAGSHVLGSPEAILTTQTSSTHYYQRPGAHYLKLDSTATALNGIAHKLVFSKTGGGFWRYAVGFTGYSPGFEANDLGYHRSVDNQMEFLWVGYRQNEAARYYASYGINFNQSLNYTNGGERVGANYNVNGWYTLPNYWNVNTGFNWSDWRYSINLLRGGPRIVVDPALNGWWGFQSDSRQDWMAGMNGYSGRNQDGSNWRGISAYTTYRPLNNLMLNVSLGANHSIDNTAWVGNFSDNQTGTTQYVTACLNQRTLNSTLRIDYTVTPELTLQYYGSPYITAGKYTKYLRVFSPESRDFNTRFDKLAGSEIHYATDNKTYMVDYDLDGITNFTMDNADFNYKQFNSNLVLRWEYRPGSTLYLVWSQGRTDFIDNGLFAARDDLNTLFSSTPEDIFLIKASYLFNL